MVFSAPRRGKSGEMRTVRAAYLGPGGAVEAQRLILHRLAQAAPLSALKRLGTDFRDLSRQLAAAF